MMSAHLVALCALMAPLTAAAACPWHGDMFGGEPGGYLMEPIAGSPTDLQAAAQSAPRALSREELVARQRELFLARYPQLAAGTGDKPTSPDAPAASPSTGNF